jgi:hypothetical protein
MPRMLAEMTNVRTQFVLREAEARPPRMRCRRCRRSRRRAPFNEAKAAHLGCEPAAAVGDVVPATSMRPRRVATRMPVRSPS